MTNTPPEDTETGFFRDPLFEAVFAERDGPAVLLRLRHRIGLDDGGRAHVEAK